MAVLILDDYESEQLVERRRSSPAYRWDEVWDGVYVVPPLPDICHSELSGLFVISLHEICPRAEGHRTGGHVNVSDRHEDWMSNVRCPDAVVYLAGNPARDRFTHWQGGPDFLVEVVMPGDRSRDKLDFYAKVGTREVLIVDRDPWLLELHQLHRGRMSLKGTVTAQDGGSIASGVIPVAFELIGRQPRPRLRLTHATTGQEWIG